MICALTIDKTTRVVATTRLYLDRLFHVNESLDGRSRRVVNPQQACQDGGCRKMCKGQANRSRKTAKPSACIPRT